MAYITTRFVSKSEEHETPQSLFAPLNDEFHFTLDVSASSENAKCEKYFTKEMNGLSQKWEGVCWMNPPFGQQIQKWVRKAYQSAQEGCTVVCLLPARTNTGYWHDVCMKGEIRFIRGYPKFGNAVQGLKAPLAIVIFRPERNLTPHALDGRDSAASQAVSSPEVLSPLQAVSSPALPQVM
jgi:phage N-6-adenine-methyltransferase